MKLKTLKDIEEEGKEQFLKDNFTTCPFVKIKAEAIKWVKEDKDLEIDQERTMVVALKSILIERWMKRLNITSEDIE